MCRKRGEKYRISEREKAVLGVYFGEIGTIAGRQEIEGIIRGHG